MPWVCFSILHCVKQTFFLRNTCTVYAVCERVVLVVRTLLNIISYIDYITTPCCISKYNVLHMHIINININMHTISDSKSKGRQMKNFEKE